MNPARIKTSGLPRIGKNANDQKRVFVIVTRAQHAKFKRLGGSTWLRERIERAKEPS